MQLIVFLLVRGLGVEPRLPGPEPGVLPLDDPRKLNSNVKNIPILIGIFINITQILLIANFDFFIKHCLN